MGFFDFFKVAIKLRFRINFAVKFYQLKRQSLLLLILFSKQNNYAAVGAQVHAE